VRAHTVNTVVEDDGVVTVADVPVKAGQRVQVIVLMPDEAERREFYPLRGLKPFQYEGPDDPVGEDEWDSGR